MKKAGFENARMVAETGLNSSPSTKGVLMSAEVAQDKSKRLIDETVPDSMASYADFFKSTYGPGALDAKTKHLVALGASLAAGCEP